MNNIKITKFDDLMREFFIKWERFENSEEFTAVKRSLTFGIKEKFYKNYFSEISLTDLKFYNTSLPLGYRIKKIIKHIFFYSLYSVKWLNILFYRKNKINFIVVNFLPDKKQSIIYMDKIFETLPSNTAIIHLGIRYEKEFLFDTNFYCFPFFFYRFLIRINKKDIEKYSEAINKSASKVNIKMDSHVFYGLIAHSLKGLAIYKILLVHLLKRGNVLYFIQDFDFIGVGYLMNYVFKNNEIKVYSIDHAITLYKSGFNIRTSDFFLVWGKEEKERLQNYCNINLNSISVIGHPDKKFNPLNLISKKKYVWLYLMNAYRSSIFHLESLRWGYLLERIKKLHVLSKEFGSNVEFIIKPHPNDKVTQNDIRLNNIKISNDELEEILPKAQIVFFEDTSLGIDLLNYDTCLAYIDTGNETLYSSIEEIPKIRKFEIEEINTIFQSKISLSKREEIYERFYEPKVFSFTNEITKISL